MTTAVCPPQYRIEGQALILGEAGVVLMIRPSAGRSSGCPGSPRPGEPLWGTVVHEPLDQAGIEVHPRRPGGRGLAAAGRGHGLAWHAHARLRPRDVDNEVPAPGDGCEVRWIFPEEPQRPLRASHGPPCPRRGVSAAAPADGIAEPGYGTALSPTSRVTPRSSGPVPASARRRISPCLQLSPAHSRRRSSVRHSWPARGVTCC